MLVGSAVWILIILAVLQAQVVSAQAETKQLRSPNPGSSYSAICVIARDENSYIREWVEYHTCLGVGKVYLYDHQSTVPLAEDVRDFVDRGVVEHIPFNGSHKRWNKKDGFADNLSKFSLTIQGQAFQGEGLLDGTAGWHGSRTVRARLQDCITRFSPLHTFIGFIDVDEFLVLHDLSIRTLDSLLKRYEGFGGVSFYWRLLGSSGHNKRPSGRVTESYQRCLPLSSFQNTQFKTFVNTGHRPKMYSPHRAMFEGNSSASFLVDEGGRRIKSGRHKSSSHSVASVYHYATKSKQDFEEKMSRGGGAGVTRPRGYLKRLDTACTETCPEAVQQYQRLCQA